MQLAGRESDPLAKLRLIRNYNRNLQAAVAGPAPISAGPRNRCENSGTALADKAGHLEEIGTASKSSGKRWVWDLYPLAKDSWGAWELEDDEQRPDHRVYIRRLQDPGVLHTPDSTSLLLNRIDFNRHDQVLVREGYVPNANDVELLERLYPGADPYRPAWYTIKADLVAAGRDAERLDKSEAPVLLTLLRKARGSTSDGATNGSTEPGTAPADKTEQGEGNGGKGTISQTTLLERLKKRAHNTPAIVYILVIAAVIILVASMMTSLETIGNAVGRAIEWWRPVGPKH